MKTQFKWEIRDVREGDQIELQTGQQTQVLAAANTPPDYTLESLARDFAASYIDDTKGADCLLTDLSSGDTLEFNTAKLKAEIQS